MTFYNIIKFLIIFFLSTIRIFYYFLFCGFRQCSENIKNNQMVYHSCYNIQMVEVIQTLSLSLQDFFPLWLCREKLDFSDTLPHLLWYLENWFKNLFSPHLYIPHLVLDAMKLNLVNINNTITINCLVIILHFNWIINNTYISLIWLVILLNVIFL